MNEVYTDLEKSNTYTDITPEGIRKEIKRLYKENKVVEYKLPYMGVKAKELFEKALREEFEKYLKK